MQASQTNESGTRYSSEETRVRAEKIILKLLARVAAQGVTGEYHGDWYYYQLTILGENPYLSLTVKENRFRNDFLTVDLSCVRVNQDGEVLYKATMIDEDHPDFEATLIEEFFKQREMIAVALQKREKLRLGKKLALDTLDALRERYPELRIELASDNNPLFNVVLRGLTEAQVDEFMQQLKAKEPTQ